MISFLVSFVLLLIFTLIGSSQSLDFLQNYCSADFIETLNFFSVLAHYESMQRGVLDARSLIYVFSFILLGLVSSNILIRSHKASHRYNKQFCFLAHILLFFMFFIINNVSKKFNWRVDLSSRQMYSLSQVSKQVVAKLQNPVTLTLFYSKSDTSIPLKYKTFFWQLEDLIASYQKHSDKIVYKFINPVGQGQSFEKIEGIKPIEIGDEKFYFSLKISSGGKTFLLDKLSLEEEVSLEYKITDAIARNFKKKAVGVLTRLPIAGLPIDPARGRYSALPAWKFVNELKSAYNLYTIPHTVAGIPPQIEVLIVLHPSHLPLQAIYALEQYLMNGGKAIIYVDPICMVSRLNQSLGRGNLPKASNLLGMLRNWGVIFDSKKVVSDKSLATIYQNNLSYSILTLSKENFNQNNIISKDITKMTLPYTGALVHSLIPTIKSTTLISASSQASLILREEAFGYKLPLSKGKKYALSLYLEGKFPTSFLLSDNYVKRNPNHLSFSKKQMKSVVLADADNLYNAFNFEKNSKSYQEVKISDNIDFVTNSLDYLCDNTYRIKLRQKNKGLNSFHKLKDRERQINIARNKKIIEVQKELAPYLHKINRLLAKRQNQQRFTHQDELRLDKLNKQKDLLQKKISLITSKAQKNYQKEKNKIFMINFFWAIFLVFIVWLANKFMRRKYD